MRGRRSPEAGKAVPKARSSPVPIQDLPLPAAAKSSRSTAPAPIWLGVKSHRRERLSCAGWSSACSGFFYFRAVPIWIAVKPLGQRGILSPCTPGHGVDEVGQPPGSVWWFRSWPQSRRFRPRMQRRGAARPRDVTERALYAAFTCWPFSTASPVSSRDLRLERTRGQPPETAWMNFESGRSMLCVMVSFTASSTGSSSMTQRE